MVHTARARALASTSTGLSLARSLILSTLLSASCLAAEPRPDANRLIPAQGVQIYLEFAGFDAHAAAWQATEAHAILNQTPAGSLVSEMATQLFDRALKELSGEKEKGAIVVEVADEALKRGFACAVGHVKPGGVCFTVVLRDFGRPENRAKLERLRSLESLGLNAYQVRPIAGFAGGNYAGFPLAHPAMCHGILFQFVPLKPAVYQKKKLLAVRSSG